MVIAFAPKITASRGLHLLNRSLAPATPAFPAQIWRLQRLIDASLRAALTVFTKLLVLRRQLSLELVDFSGHQARSGSTAMNRIMHMLVSAMSSG